MASSFPAHVAYGEDAGSLVEEYTPGTAAGEQMLPGEFVIWDDSNNWVERSGADPAAGTILGICEVDSEQARVLTASGKIPIRTLKPGAVLCMSSATTPVLATHLQQEYGITRNSTTGFWQVDVAKTGADARVKVVRLQLGTGLDGVGEKWYVIVLGEFLANAGIDT